MVDPYSVIKRNEVLICATIWMHLFFLMDFNELFMFYFWLHWVFIAACGLSLVAASGGYSLLRASHCGGFSCCGARALGTQASVVVAHGLSRCGSRALERRLSSCGARA